MGKADRSHTMKRLERLVKDFAFVVCAISNMEVAVYDQIYILETSFLQEYSKQTWRIAGPEEGKPNSL